MTDAARRVRRKKQVAGADQEEMMMLRCARNMPAVLLFLAVTVQAEPPIIPPDAGLPVIDWKDAGNYVDKNVVVQGKIVLTKNTGKMCFLNFDAARSFTAIVREPVLKKFSQPPEKMYDQKVVRIHGVISEYKGKPQIEISSPEQVTILEQEQPIPPKPEVKKRAFDGTVTIATFNTLNLFDEYDDPYASDESTPPKPKEELQALAKTIRALDADVVALEEVENRGYLERFVTAMLGEMGYDSVVCFEGNDRRGIDCAVLSRLPVGPVTSHRHLRFNENSATPEGPMSFRRDLLQVRIEPPDGPAFHVFVVHFKSKRDGGGSADEYRLGEARQARRIIDGLLSKDKDALFVVCGDFNDTFASKPVKALRGEGETALRDFLADLPKDAVTYNKAPRSVIDFILASPAMGGRYVAKSYKIVPGSVETAGSDHNPVVAKFDLKKNAE
jgi:endonuclease/exonuclease/phosphatase family metal-dependent hydrolase